MGTGATGSASNDRFYRQYTYNPFTYHGVKWVNIPGSGNTNQTVTIRAKGTQSSGVWPTMQLWVNGSLKASWQVNDTAWQSYSTSVAFTGREQIDVVFTNDGGTRDLFVENIKVGTVTLAANTAIYDRGAGNDAFNGDDVIAGQQGLYWNGALRFVYGSTATAMGYDLNGNMTYKLKQGEATVYTWNAENRLSAVTRNSSVLESYVYDMDGNRIQKSVTSGPVTRTFFPGHYEEEVTGGITTVVKHYSFNGQIIATQQGTTLSYLHTDHLSSNNLATSSSGTQTASRTYYAYGTTRSSSGTLPTDRTFTGQKQDSTGLLYFNARYYDSALGQFLSPDTLVPDAGVVLDYNRFAYARLNPLKYTDPTGHETSKPDWWPPFLPYVFDLPDDMTYEEFVVWASENNIPTAFSGQAGVSMTAGFLGGGAFSVEVQGTINWLSGEYMLSFNNGGGFRAGTPANGGGFHVGSTLHYRASTTTVLEGASLFSSIDGAAEAGPEAGLVATYARAMDYTDLNDNDQFDLGDSVKLKSVIDPDFDRPVESLSVDATVGVDLTPNLIDVGLTGGMKDTTNIFTLDLYAPVRWMFD